ncbi:MAG: hypothetical protein R2912_06495 [Eubacteriales bacterium]
MNDRVAGVATGLDLEMPFVGPYHDRQIERAVKSGAHFWKRMWMPAHSA